MKPSKTMKPPKPRQPDSTADARRRRAFYERRARAGGVARAAARSPLWKKLCMHFLTERRLGRTSTTTFKAWLLERGFAKIAAEGQGKRARAVAPPATQAPQAPER